MNDTLVRLPPSISTTLRKEWSTPVVDIGPDQLGPVIKSKAFETSTALLMAVEHADGVHITAHRKGDVRHTFTTVIRRCELGDECGRPRWSPTATKANRCLGHADAIAKFIDHVLGTYR